MYNQKILHKTASITHSHSSNISISKHLQIDSDLNCFITIDAKEHRIVDLLLNKSIDSVLSVIHKSNKKDIYNDFSFLLDDINSFLKKLSEDSEEDINMIIWVLHKKTFYFSKIWQASAYLIQKDNVVEISDFLEKDTHFSYVSNGNISIGEYIVLSNIRLFDYLTVSDLLDWARSGDIWLLEENIKSIISGENTDLSIDFTMFKFGDLIQNREELEDKLAGVKNTFYKLWDQKIIKRMLAYYSLGLDKLNKQNKVIKSSIFFLGILVSFGLLYIIIHSVISTSYDNVANSEDKTKLIEARDYISLASENLNNPEIYDLNLNKAKVLLEEVKLEWKFLKDIEELEWSMSIINKQFNGVEVFESSSTNQLYNLKEWDKIIKILGNANKLYLVWENYIRWPLLPWSDLENQVFDDIWENKFIDSSFGNNSIFSITWDYKVVEFLNWNYKFVDTVSQEKWEKSKIIESYNGNIYLLSDDSKQIMKHKPMSDGYTPGEGFLKNEDAKKNIYDIAIDWWIYILNDDLTILKAFWVPYRLESIIINKLPNNYDLEDRSSNIEIIARNDLNYVYIFMNNKLWILEPNSRSYKDVKNLTYLGQIEWKNEKIENLYVKQDWEIIIQNKTGIYKLNFDVTDGKVFVRN